MKLLENADFEALSSSLTFETNVCKIETRIESYSCKMAGDCKRLYKRLNKQDEKLGTSPLDAQLLAPPSTHASAAASSLSHSPSGFTNFMHSTSLSDDPDSPFSNCIPKKTLFYLISTLNASYQPDYDFSNTLSTEFSKEPCLDFVLNSIENLPKTYDVYSTIKTKLWQSIDKEINLSDCEYYSYNPDLTSDPYGEDGCLWFYNYFFYNKKMKRIVFISCRCISKSVDSDYQSYDQSNYVDNEFICDDDHNKMIGLVNINIS